MDITMNWPKLAVVICGILTLAGTARADFIDFSAAGLSGGTNYTSYASGNETIYLAPTSGTFGVKNLTSNTVLAGPTTNGTFAFDVILQGYTPSLSSQFTAQYSSKAQGIATVVNFSETVGSYSDKFSGTATWYETASNIYITGPGVNFVNIANVSGVSVNGSPLGFQTDADPPTAPLPNTAWTSVGLLGLLGGFHQLRRRARTAPAAD